MVAELQASGYRPKDLTQTRGDSNGPDRRLSPKGAQFVAFDSEIVSIRKLRLNRALGHDSTLYPQWDGAFCYEGLVH